MYFVYFSHVLGGSFYGELQELHFQHVDVNWGLDSGEVSIVDWPFVLSNLSESSCTNVIHIILSNSMYSELSIFTIWCVYVCVYVCVHVSVNQ